MTTILTQGGSYPTSLAQMQHTILAKPLWTFKPNIVNEEERKKAFKKYKTHAHCPEFTKWTITDWDIYRVHDAITVCLLDDINII